jgi:hypothetical protein
MDETARLPKERFTLSRYYTSLPVVIALVIVPQANRQAGTLARRCLRSISSVVEWIHYLPAIAMPRMALLPQHNDAELNFFSPSIVQISDRRSIAALSWPLFAAVCRKTLS